MRQIPSIKTRQRFKATPQLRNAIELLQLSGSELQLEIQQAIETNALLEIENNNPQQFVDEVVDTNAPPYNESIRSDSDWPNDTRIEDQDD
ncbi:MAG: RNA polymerase factor sigma-54, partial [Pseudomonadota bacterium]|nr:RNA polymerase factor sigma-54 [Pseudomonadota bacterium]